LTQPAIEAIRRATMLTELARVTVSTRWNLRRGSRGKVGWAYPITFITLIDAQTRHLVSELDGFL
jgi:hypothetical protein